MKLSHIILLGSAIIISPLSSRAEDNSTRNERNFIVEGNELYRNKQYADAEVAYRKALEIDAMNEIAQFNLAAALLRQGTATGENEKQASQILGKLASDAENMAIAEKAYYNLGNIAFNGQDYAKSIELYKNALRRNPDNDKARENLRLAQKRLEEQQNQDQKDDKNQDQKDDKKQDQNKDQNKDNNQDQNKDQNKDQDKNQDQQQQPQDQKQQPQQQPQQQSGISKENAEKILKAMENEENATRQRVNAERQKNGAPARRQVTNPW